MENKRMITTVYVCCPYRLKQEMDAKDKLIWETDVKAARMLCRFLVKLGYMPLAPHLYFNRFLSTFDEQEWTDAQLLSQEWLMQADEMWVIGNVLTQEMACEITAAEKRHIPIRHLGLSDPANKLEWIVRDM